MRSLAAKVIPDGVPDVSTELIYHRPPDGWVDPQTAAARPAPLPQFTRLTVRPLTPRRLSPLCSELTRLAAHGQSPADLAADLTRCVHPSNDNHHAWIAMVGAGAFVGAIVAEHNDHDVMWIRRLWIDFDWRHTDVAEALLEAVLHECWLSYVPTVMLAAPVEWRTALPVFAGSGYRFVRSAATTAGDVAMEFHCELYA